MKTRRDFLKTAGFAVVAGLIAPQLLTPCKGGTSKQKTNKNIGLQLYSLRDMANEKGIAEVLKIVAEMGYKNLETASYNKGKIYGLAPAELKKMASDLDLTITSAHLGQAYLPEKADEIMAWWDQAIETHAALGTRYMIQPSMHVDENSTLDYLKMYCDYFSEVGQKVKLAGMQFGYHNHAFEFKKIDDRIIFDYLLQNVDKQNVLFELDVYWIMKGGYSPSDYMKKYASQIRVLHIKDEKEIGASGEIDFKPIFELAYANKIEDWYVEVEQYTNNNPIESVKQSYEFLNNANYVK
ncbi:MAG: sugar phosphate isomerase/epimerase [Prevotellaceae bacterium]|jgi:sugar phosphate isomerase/epimerase|nr:sugar phosphate isomerase/epimerase [Prevotellaceae bacterium]